MREIKFRMWNDQAERFHYGMGAFECLKQQFCGTYDHVGLNQAAFEQFTGLHDKDGFEIFEGDIIRAYVEGYNCGGFGDWETVVVTYNDLNAGFVNCRFKNKGEVIGNIHENPELFEPSSGE